MSEQAEYLAPDGAERQLEEQSRRSHRRAMLFTFGALAAIVVVALFSLLKVRSASAVAENFENAIARVDGGGKRGNELQRLQALVAESNAMRQQLAVSQAQVTHLQQKVTYLQRASVPTGSEPRCAGNAAPGSLRSGAP